MSSLTYLNKEKLVSHVLQKMKGWRKNEKNAVRRFQAESMFHHYRTPCKDYLLNMYLIR